MALLRGCYICCVLIMVVKRIANPWSLIRLVGSTPSHSVYLSTIAIHRYVSVEKESVYCIALDGFCQRVRVVKVAVLKTACQKWLVGSNPSVGVCVFAVSHNIVFSVV